MSTSAGRCFRSALEDGINDNVDVTYDVAKGVLTVKQPGGHCDEFFDALDANDVVWDDFDPSDSRNTREKLVRVTMVSVSGKTGENLLRQGE